MIQLLRETFQFPEDPLIVVGVAYHFVNRSGNSFALKFHERDKLLNTVRSAQNHTFPLTKLVDTTSCKNIAM